MKDFPDLPRLGLLTAPQSWSSQHYRSRSYFTRINVLVHFAEMVSNEVTRFEMRLLR